MLLGGDGVFEIAGLGMGGGEDAGVAVADELDHLLGESDGFGTAGQFGMRGGGISADDIIPRGEHQHH